MQPLQVQDVIELLRDEIDRVGGQSEWARQTGVQRALINRVLNGRILPPSQLCRVLGLEWVLVRHVAQSDGETKSVIIGHRDFIRILREEINKAGSIIAWSKRFGVDRTHLSSVLHKRRPPDKKILAALDVSEVLVQAEGSEAAIRNRWRQNIAPGREKRHARW
jgi:DNA-binding phage protein